MTEGNVKRRKDEGRGVLFSFEGTIEREFFQREREAWEVKSGLSEGKSGDNDAEEPPVPIPNTEVKL